MKKKITESQIKLAINRILEIKEGGPGSGQKGHTTQHDDTQTNDSPSKDEKPKATLPSFYIRKATEGISFPSGTQIRKDYSGNEKISWDKKGGYGGEKMLSKITKQVEDAGWKKVSSNSGDSPTGDVSNSGVVWEDPTGEYILSTSKRYGVTSSENKFGFSINKKNK